MDDYTQQFERLFAAYSDAIFRHLYFRLGHRERAKELTQEVFMRLWQHLIAEKAITYEKAFLYKIAHNLFINEIRTDKTSYSLDDMTETVGYEVVEASPGPQTQSEYREILRHLDILSPPYREVVVMRYVDGLPVKEIATILGEQETNISMRISRAIKQLRYSYEPES